MLAYAAGRPKIGERRPNPNMMLFIISAHIAAVAAIMSAKMDLPKEIRDGPTIVQLLRTPTPPPPKEFARTKPVPRQIQQPTYTPAPRVPTQLPPEQLPDATPLPQPGAGDPAVLPEPREPVQFDPTPVPVSTPAQPLTAPSDLRPPYPESKLLAGEEAALTLRLSIDERGRVVAVDPVGRADAVFLAAARRHLIAHWRYKPAMENGRAVASTLVVSLRFELDD